MSDTTIPPTTTDTFYTPPPTAAAPPAPDGGTRETDPGAVQEQKPEGSAATPDQAEEAKATTRPYDAAEVDDALLKTLGCKREAELTALLTGIASIYGVKLTDLRKDRTRLQAAVKKQVQAAAVSGKPVIKIAPDLEAVHNAAIEALAKDVRLYRRGTGNLERIVRVTGGAISPLPEALLPEYLTTSAQWLGQNGAPAVPSAVTTKAIHQRGDYPTLRALQGVVSRPTLLADGRVLETPGYDTTSCLYYQPDGEWQALPDLPSTQEELLALALKSKEMLIDAVVDFPFATVTDRAVWLAEVQTVEARFLLKECLPQFVHTANVKGTGKGALAKLTGIISTGTEPETRFLPSGRDGEDELEKRITAIAMVNPALVFFDEVQFIRSRTMQMVATSRMYAGRKLGASEDFKGRIDFVTIYAGNNTSICGDMTRRTILCHLESPFGNPAVDRPKSSYAHPERSGEDGTLMQWAAGASRDLHLAALTILRAFLASQAREDAPKIECGLLGSFEEWSALIARCLVWVAEPDVTMAVAGDEDDDDTNELRTLLDAWAAAFGPIPVSAGDALEYVRAGLSHLPPVQEWRNEDIYSVKDVSVGGVPVRARRVGSSHDRRVGRSAGSRPCNGRARTA